MKDENEKRRARVRSRFLIPAAVAVLALPVLVASCGDDNTASAGNLSGSIKVDGSSTVGPLSEAAAELFREENPDVRATVGISGTGGGFEKFCAGETDINDASREIEKEEIDACKKKGIGYGPVLVANDGLAVVVNPDNDWADCLTTAELKKLWEPGSKVNNWNQVRSSFPDEKIELFGPGTDSGTFEYFNEAINGDKAATRKDYSPSEDDNVTVQGVSGGKGNLGYFGLSYAIANKDKVKTIQVDGGDGCVEPTTQTVQDKSYKPLSRPLFIYPSTDALKRQAVKEFVQYYVDNHDAIAKQAQFVPLTAEQNNTAKDELTKLAG
jgi:phosphate transport system substrate-binding protein